MCDLGRGGRALAVGADGLVGVDAPLLEEVHAHRERSDEFLGLLGLCHRQGALKPIGPHLVVAYGRVCGAEGVERLDCLALDLREAFGELEGRLAVENVVSDTSSVILRLIF